MAVVEMTMMRMGFGLFFGGFAVLEKGSDGGDDWESVKEKKEDGVDIEHEDETRRDGEDGVLGFRSAGGKKRA
jgi:hypothetical protein